MSCRRVCAVPAPAPARLRRARPAPSPGARTASRRTAARRRASPRGGARSRPRSPSAPAAGAASRTPPRSARATASSAATRGRRRTCRRRGRRRASARASTSGSSWESISTICASRRSASTASGCPCGDHTIVARSLTTSGSTIVSSLGRWRSPISSSTRSRPTEIAPDCGRVLGADAHASPTAAAGPARPPRGPAATGGSARRARAGSRSRRGTRVSTITTMFITRAGTYARSSLWRCGEHVAQRRLDRAGRRVVLAPDVFHGLEPPPAVGGDQLVGGRRPGRCPTRTCAAARRRPPTPSGSGR